jgi:hypothetical protein
MKWKEDVNSKVVLANDEPIPLLLLANKVQASISLHLFSRSSISTNEASHFFSVIYLIYELIRTQLMNLLNNMVSLDGSIHQLRTIRILVVFAMILSLTNCQ